MNVPVLGEDGTTLGNVELLDEIFAVRVNVPLMHQVVTAQLAAARAGTHKTKTRGEVRGGGKKPWRQKGTGRARHGSIREPQWKGGGTAFGPTPRDHSVSVNKKMRAAALRSALSARAADGKVIVVDGPRFDLPKTKRARSALGAWNAGENVLLVLERENAQAAYSFRNLPKVHPIAQDQLNVYDVLKAETVVFSRDALSAFQERLTGSGRVVATAAPEPEEPAAETEEEVTRE